MADQVTRKMPLAKERKPSRLRHEIRPDSMDDNRDSHGDVVQAPHSDTIVFDTQLDTYGCTIEHLKTKNHKSDLTEPPLSPNSQVTLKRFEATRKNSIPEPDTILFNTFSKELVEPGGGSVLPSQPFSYGRAVRTASRTNTKTGPIESLLAAHTTSTSSKNEERSDQRTHARVDPATTAPQKSQEVPVNMPDVRNGAGNEELYSSILPPQPFTTDDYLKQPSHSSPKPRLSFRFQRKPFPRAKTRQKNISFGKHRKSTKTLPIQQHVSLWPPRRNDTLDDVQPRTDVRGILLNDSINILHAAKLKKDDDQPKDFTTKSDAVLPIDSHDSSKPTPGHQLHKINTQKGIEGEDETEAYSATEEMLQKTPPRPRDTSAPPPVSAPSLPAALAVNTQYFVANLEQEVSKEDHEEISKCSRERTASNNQALMPSPKSRNDTLLCASGSGNDLYESRPPLRVSENTQSPTAKLVTSQEAPHQTPNPGVPSRIVKPRMKSRMESKPTSHGSQGASISPVVDRALKSLEMAFLAESFRNSHEHTTELKHAAEKVTLYVQTIDFQKQFIVELTNQREKLKIALDSLTRKAKANQKFLEGCQNDYERLKRLTTTAQEDNKKTLQASIVEIEEEKHTLRRELEMTACKLAESQRKIRVVTDELYVKLAMTLSANEILEKILNELEEAYKIERTKREDVETGLLNGFQDLQCQFSNTSSALINKLEQLQTSVEKTAACGHQDTNIRECLEILNSLKITPLLKVQDVHKAEGMLCFVRTRVESGLEDIHKAITCKGPSNADLHASINEQLQDLRANMMRYEELAAENYRIKESNVALEQQLEAQKHEYALLNEKVEYLKQVETDLKGRSSKLERDMGSMKTATHSSRSEMSEVEQTNRDLCQQLNKMESELLAVNAKADDAETSRKNLEIQAAEYKMMPLTRYEATAKEQMAEKQSAETTCEKLSEEFRLRLSEKQQELESETNRLEVALHEQETLCQKLSNDLSIANARLDKLKKSANDQEDANSKLQTQVSLQQSAIQDMRQEADERVSQMQKDAQSILELAQNKVLLLENENQTLLAELSQARGNEHKMQRVEEAISAEKELLHQEIRSMHSVIDKKDAEIAQIRKECANEHQRVIEQCRNDVDDYKHRLAETTASLKEAEANAKPLEDHHQAKMAADRKTAVSKFLELEKEYRNALQFAKEQSIPIERCSTHDSSSNPSISQSAQRFPTVKERKRAERGNRSVVEASQEQIHSLDFPTLSHTEGSQAQFEDQDLFATFVEDTNDFLQGRASGDSRANHGYNSIPTIQDLGSLPFSQAVFTERQAEATAKEPPHQTPSSSGFSSVSSHELARLQKEVESESISKLHGRDIGSCRLVTSLDNEKGETFHMNNVSVTSSLSSQTKERPRSQANTSSRMMPPPHGSASKQIQSPHQSQVIRIKLPSQHEKFDSILQRLSGSVSPDKRKFSTSEADSDLTSKRQCEVSSLQPESSSSGLRRRSPRLSRKCVGGSILLESDTSHTKSDVLEAPHSRSQGHSSESQSGRSNFMSSDRAHLSRQQPSHKYTTPSKRHSSRITCNQSRNGTAFEDEVNDCFNEELQGLH